MDKQQLESILQTEIPITVAMGIKVDKISDTCVKLSAPLSKNINHKSTAFGGSLYSVCVLAGWSMLYLKFKALDENSHIVIQESEIHYLLPVSEEIRAICQIDGAENFSRAIKTYSKKGKARVELTTTVYSGDEVAVMFKGKYVIHQ